jgi:dCTP diphosphatase
MNDKITTIQEVKDKLGQFMIERNWEQFHSPKNLAMSIAIEAGELMEHFQWQTSEKSIEIMESNRAEIEKEIADVGILLLELCRMYNVDLSKAIENKMEINSKRYQVEKCKGKPDKYTAYL